VSWSLSPLGRERERKRDVRTRAAPRRRAVRQAKRAATANARGSHCLEHENVAVQKAKKTKKKTHSRRGKNHKRIRRSCLATSRAGGEGDRTICPLCQRNTMASRAGAASPASATSSRSIAPTRRLRAERGPHSSGPSPIPGNSSQQLWEGSERAGRFARGTFIMLSESVCSFDRISAMPWRVTSLSARSFCASV
jgi:hypothetical protein